MKNRVWVLGDAVVDLIPEEGDRLLKCPGGGRSSAKAKNIKGYGAYFCVWVILMQFIHCDKYFFKRLPNPRLNSGFPASCSNTQRTVLFSNLSAYSINIESSVGVSILTVASQLWF